MHNEFDLIRRYFALATDQREDTPLGIGDDCALLQIPPGQQLAVSMDTLVSGHHFVADVEPASLGHKALAVNLSDLAAMGAEPAWATLSLSLPGANAHWRNWLQKFISGFSALARQYDVQLVGGDTTRGPLSITVQAHGLIPAGMAMRRDAAKTGDLIYVSGTLGDAGLALRLQQAQPHTGYLFERLHKPTPRIALGLALRGIVHAAIDISDGLGADLAHVCDASGVGARLDATALPLSALVARQVANDDDWRLPLNAGDDYELVFTAPASQATAVQQAARQSATPISCIGTIQAGQDLQLIMPDGQVHTDMAQGYDHFSG